MNGRGERVSFAVSPLKPPSRHATHIQPPIPLDDQDEADARVDAVPDQEHARDPDRGEEHATAAPGTGSGVETASRWRPAHHAKKARTSIPAQIRRTVLRVASPRRTTNVAPATSSRPMNARIGTERDAARRSSEQRPGRVARGPTLMSASKRASRSYAVAVSLYRLTDHERLVDPLMVVAFDAWIDAGSASTSAAALLAEGGTRIATIDGDALFDYRARRPTLRIQDGHLVELEWPDLDVMARRIGGRDVLVLSGPEPDYRWRELADDAVRSRASSASSSG